VEGESQTVAIFQQTTTDIQQEIMNTQKFNYASQISQNRGFSASNFVLLEENFHFKEKLF